MRNKIIGIFVCILMIAGGISTNALSINWNNNTIPNSVFEDPPTSFDLRDVNGKNYVTGVKNQMPYGTCNEHAAMAAMESNLLISGNWENTGDEGEPDLSESHLRWWHGFDAFSNEDTFGSPRGLIIEGGDSMMETAYYSRGNGPVRERDAPYDDISKAPEITNPNYHYYYMNDIEWYDIGEDLRNMNLIKNTIMTYGAISITYCYNLKFLDENFTHYQPPASNDFYNHCVTVIGWDDNKVTKAPEKGAWLCKNSFGSSWGLDGYFWISYYDKWCCHYDARCLASSYQGIKPMPYNQIYYHDFHGWVDTLSDSTEAFNAFYSTSENVLQAVSFFTTTDNVDYIVRIYDNFENNELKGELSNKSGTILHMGFHTVDLHQPVNLQPDDYFYIYLKLSNGGQPYDRTINADEWWVGFEVDSISHRGESYYYSDGAWGDLYYVDMSANFCIKGLGTRDIPDLTVAIKPGFNVGINVIFTNNGLENVKNVPWKITVTGGFLDMMYQRNAGMIDLRAGELKTISTKMFFGLGGIIINTRIDIFAKTVAGSQLFIFTKVK